MSIICGVLLYKDSWDGGMRDFREIIISIIIFVVIGLLVALFASSGGRNSKK